MRRDGVPMTRAQAVAEARRRWSAELKADEYAYAVGNWIENGRRQVCEVGVMRLRDDLANHPAKGWPPYWELRGSGKTWEAAFADADRREQEQHHA